MFLQICLDAYVTYRHEQIAWVIRTLRSTLGEHKHCGGRSSGKISTVALRASPSRDSKSPPKLILGVGHTQKKGPSKGLQRWSPCEKRLAPPSNPKLGGTLVGVEHGQNIFPNRSSHCFSLLSLHGHAG